MPDLVIRFSGDLRISIEPGLDITIPNHELVRSFIDINSDGQEYISNSSTQVMGLYAMDSQTADSMPAFGRTFLAGAYLMVDADEQKFTIWKGQSSSEQRLVAHGPSPCPESTATSSTTPSATSDASARDSSSVIPKGAIAGICTALILIIAFCISIGYLLAKKSRQRKTASDDDEQKTKQLTLESDGDKYQKPELSSDQNHQQPHEMSLGKIHGDTIGPYEVTAAEIIPIEMPGTGKPVEVPANGKTAVEISSGHYEPAELPSTRMSTSSSRILSPASPTKKPQALFRQTLSSVKTPAQKP